MFIWLASYPKSGNTLLRSMLALYFFSEDGIFNFELIKTIKQFPAIGLFEQIGVDTKSEDELIKNYIRVQELINEKNSIQFLKTHSSFFSIKGNRFTNLNNTLGVIYIVRDPRNVVSSFSHHMSFTIEEAANHMMNNHFIGGNKSNPDTPSSAINTYTGNWIYHYQTWKEFKSQRKYLLVKYEDLISDKKNTFLKILEFIYKLNKKKFTVDENKLNNVIETTSFENMQSLEKKFGFDEAKLDKKNDSKIKPFFNLGQKNKWENLLDNDIRKKIEKSFKKEMKELGYL